MMCVAEHQTEIRQSLKIARRIERRVVVGKVVVAETENAFAVGGLRLERIPGEYIQACGKIHTPAEDALVARDRPANADITRDGGELHMANLFLFPANINSAVGGVIYGPRIRID